MLTKMMIIILLVLIGSLWINIILLKNSLWKYYLIIILINTLYILLIYLDLNEESLVFISKDYIDKSIEVIVISIEEYNVFSLAPIIGESRFSNVGASNSLTLLGIIAACILKKFNLFLENSNFDNFEGIYTNYKLFNSLHTRDFNINNNYKEESWELNKDLKYYTPIKTMADQLPIPKIYIIESDFVTESQVIYGVFNGCMHDQAVRYAIRNNEWFNLIDRPIVPAELDQTHEYDNAYERYSQIGISTGDRLYETRVLIHKFEASLRALDYFYFIDNPPITYEEIDSWAEIKAYNEFMYDLLCKIRTDRPTIYSIDVGKDIYRDDLVLGRMTHYENWENAKIREARLEKKDIYLLIPHSEDWSKPILIISDKKWYDEADYFLPCGNKLPKKPTHANDLFHWHLHRFRNEYWEGKYPRLKSGYERWRLTGYYEGYPGGYQDGNPYNPIWQRMNPDKSGDLNNRNRNEALSIDKKHLYNYTKFFKNFGGSFYKEMNDDRLNFHAGGSRSPTYRYYGVLPLGYHPYDVYEGIKDLFNVKNHISNSILDLEDQDIGLTQLFKENLTEDAPEDYNLKDLFAESLTDDFPEDYNLKGLFEENTIEDSFINLSEDISKNDISYNENILGEDTSEDLSKDYSSSEDLSCSSNDNILEDISDNLPLNILEEDNYEDYGLKELFDDNPKK